MKMRILTTFVSLCFLFLLMITGCGPKPESARSILDTPDNHYSQGLRLLKNNQPEEAAREFKRANALDPDYAGGYVGLGLVLAAKEKYPEALDYVNKGLDKNDQFVDGYVAKGRILVMQQKGDDWLKDSLKEFNKALKIKPNHEGALFYIGIAYKTAYEFDNAATAFGQVIAIKGDYAKEADAEYELIQKIQRAAPGSKIGMKIALMPEIDRADLAVLFIEELKLMEVISKKKPKTYDTEFKPPTDPTAKPKTTQAGSMPQDIEGHWAKSWIENVLSAGVIETFPDGTFHPDEKIIRSNYALFLQNILILVTGDESLATKYLGTDSRFPDVNSTHYAYNAICLTVDRGIMQADTMDGAFHMNDTVSGADALLIIRKFQNALRMTF